MSFPIMVVPACTDDKEEQNLPPIPDFNQMTLKGNLHSDGDDAYRTDTYVFSNDKLATHTTVQGFCGQSLTRGVTLSYSNNEVTLTDENGNTDTYILGDTGYATECTYELSSQIRKYEFTYPGEHLARIGEEIDGTPYSSMESTYDNRDSSHVIANGQQTNCQVGNTKNLYQFPCLQVCDIYPPPLHADAVYVRLLDTQSRYLIIGNAPEGDKEKYTKYAYELDKDGRPAGIIAKTTSTGTVININGSTYNEMKTDTRTINISIE